MRPAMIAIALTITTLLTGCAVEMVPRPYAGPIVLSDPVRPYVVGITPLGSTSYSVMYVPGVISEATIVASFRTTCSSRGLVAVRGPGVTRQQTFRHRRRAPTRVNVFTVTCR